MMAREREHDCWAASAREPGQRSERVTPCVLRRIQFARPSTTPRRDQGPFPTLFGPEDDTRLCHPDESGPGDGLRSEQVGAARREPDQGANCRPVDAAPWANWSDRAPAGPGRDPFARGRGPKTESGWARRGRGGNHTHEVWRAIAVRPLSVGRTDGWGRRVEPGLVVVGSARWAVARRHRRAASRRRFTRLAGGDLGQNLEESPESLAWSPVYRVGYGS